MNSKAVFMGQLTLINEFLLSIISVVFLLSLALLTGCSASLRETHLIVAHDPDTGVTNYFKIDFDGDTFLSKSKFSLGEYDRDAVNRLFSEADLKREYLATDTELYDASGSRIRDLATALQNAKTAIDDEVPRRLDRLNSSIAHEIGIYETLIFNDATTKTRYQELLNTAKTQREKGEKLLSDNKYPEASAAFQKAVGIVSTTRLLIKGAHVVRHFDPAGNEINVRNKSLLVFVSTDTSRFTSAISQLADSDAATSDLLKIILGPKIRKQKSLELQVESSNEVFLALVQRMKEQIENSKASTADQKATILKMAREVAGITEGFSDAKEVRAFVKGMGVPQ